MTKLPSNMWSRLLHAAMGTAAPAAATGAAAATAAVAFALAAGAPSAIAQPWPDKPLKFVVPFPPGGPLEFVTRAVAEPLQAKSGHAVIVDNKPGAAGNIGIQQVARAAPDGSSWLFVPQGNITINPTLIPNLPFNWERDFTPVTLLAYTPNVLVVHPSMPARDVAELIAHARANPGKLSYASPGNGSSLHLIGELLKREAKIDLLHVPYKGTTQALQDLIGGQVQLMFGALPTLLPQVRSGKLRALAVTTSRRAESAPELPTLAEAGVKGIDVPSWYGVMAPAGTPAAAVARAQAAIADVLAQSANRERLLAQGLTPVASRPDDFAAQIKRETAVWAALIREAGIKAD